jgi:hypothetical protein
MPLNTLNTGAISFKKLVGKAHTQQGFAFTEESIASTVSSSISSVFADRINPIPATSGLTALYATDGTVQKIRFEVEIIPDTLIGTNRSQGYRLKLPSVINGWNANGALYPTFSAGTKVHTSLGKLQIVPSLYGRTKSDGSNEYDPILYQTNGSTVIAKFDPINWIIDSYNGILFVQDPPAGYDVSASRPGFVDAYLFVGDYLDQKLVSGLTGTSVEWSDILNKPLTFPPSAHVHPISGVTGLQGALDNKISISEKGVAGGVTPLDINNLVPLIHIPSIFKEVYVVPTIAARTARFVASGITGTTAVTSFEGLRVYVLDCTGAPELPTGTTGACESIDTTGFLNWSAITSSQTIDLDWTNIANKPPLVNRILNGGGLNIIPFSGTGYTTISIDVDNVYIETQVPSGNVSIIEQSIDPSRLKFQGGNTGTTGQYIIRGTGNTFSVGNLPLTGVSTVSTSSGVTNIGTSQNPILIAQVDAGDNTIEATAFGLRVKNSSIGSNKINFGSAPFQFNADNLLLNSGTTFSGSSTDVGTAIEELQGMINQNYVLTITGATNIGTGQGHVYVTGSTGQTLQFKKIKQGNKISVTQTGTDITIAVTGISATTGTTTIGPAEDGTYTDGLFIDFVPTTPIGTAVDRFNEVLKALAPPPAPDLSQATGSGTFVAGKLSFGSSKVIAGFTNVGTNAGNAAVDINGNYAISGTRLGLTATPITGVLNSSVVGGGGGIPYANTAFGDGHLGKLIMYKNGLVHSTLILSGTTGATSNSRMAVTAVQPVKFPSGQPLAVFTYRTGTFSIPVSAMTNGYNYIRIVHSGATFSRQTNFTEWVYDPDASTIALIAPSGLTNLTLGGSKFISGVNYHTSGSVKYQGTFSNVYKNVFSNSATAIDFHTRENLAAMTLMDVTGAGIVPRLASALQTLPDLDIAASNPQNTNITVLGTLPINVSLLLGNVGTLGRVRSSVAVLHPFAAQGFSGAQSTLTGFLFNTVNQVTNLNNETFDGEVDRLEARDYSVLTYANVDGGTYAWSPTQNLISGNAQHNTGLLVFNGELLYPNAAYLTSTYGITTGNFGAVTNAPVGNPNYTAAAGGRSHYRKFKSANGSTQSTLTFTIAHTGVLADFLTNGGTGGVPASNQIKFEFLIMRSGGAIHGWANPFAPSGNPEGIANTSSSHSAGVTTVSCTLATTPRVAINDIVVVRILTSSVYSNRISNEAITNI